MAKFFYNKVYNTKRTIINLVIIGVCIIGVIICFIITSNFQGENHNTKGGEVSLKKESTIEVNEKFTKEIFFSKIENVNLDDIKVTYPDDFDVSKVGTYTINLEISNKPYTTTLVIVDTIKPEMTLKTITINEGETYNPKDFVESCTDNSEKECQITFAQNSLDEDGNTIDYSVFKDIGSYSIKITATDNANNENTQETTLNIVKRGTEITDPETPNNPDTPTNCKYGNGEYDTSSYLIAVPVTNNGCAISLDLYKDSQTASGINKLMETETVRIQKDVNALNLKGTPTLNRKVTAVINTSGDGIVGYELKMTVIITNNEKSETVADYKIDSNGKRVFTTNPYNLSN